MKTINLSVLSAIFLGLSPFGGWACESAPRTTLALYDGNREPAPRDTRIHHFTEIILNHLGHRILYHDVSGNDLPDVDPGSVGLVLSWFDEPPAGTAAIWNWIASAEGFCDGMPRIVAIQETGIGADIHPEIASLIENTIGIRADGATYGLGPGASLSRKAEWLFDHEADFLFQPGSYPGIHAGPAGQAVLTAASGAAEVDLAVLGPAGGYLHRDAAVAPDGRGGAFWIVDPFAFFGHVLGSAPWPIPDPTTLAGRRVFFSTVTAEGWLDVMPARAFGEPERLASEVLVEQLIKPFADLPITVAALTGDFDSSLGGRAAARGRQAEALALSRPNVRGGSQGHSDIRDWDFFASYDQTREAEILDSGDSGDQQGGLVLSAVQTLGDAFADTGASAFSRVPDAPRKYAGAPFDLETEITGSLQEIGSISGGGEKPGVFLWGGNARPFESALTMAEQAGAEGIGGGGGVYRAGRGSLTGLWPFAAQVGTHLQVYDALSGDAGYTGLWTAPLYGFHGLAETLARTEEPRRLKPFELAFAARSAIFFDTRRAIQRHFELARQADVIPVHAARYAAMVRGFHQMQAQPQAQGGWRILDRGGLQTVRFDGAGGLALDLGQSSGAMGARRKGDSLYVALDPGIEAPLVVLAPGDAPSGMILATAAPALISSRVEVTAWRRTECSVELQAEGVAGGALDLLGVAGNSYRVRTGADGATQDQAVTADAEGRISILLPIGADGTGSASVLGPCEAGG